MKSVLRVVVMGLAIVGMVAGAIGAGKLLTQDPLTKLPVIPQTDSKMHLGNEPNVLPAYDMCKSKIQTDFYSLYDIKTSDTLKWYAQHLSGFKRAHGYGSKRSQDEFYNAEGTMIVGITGEPAPDGQDSDGYAVTYMRVEPGLKEETIKSLPSQNIVCK